ncbi:MAG: HEPN domain-containing protein [Proteobacteria bacterium]|nr:HEPN domain-containing protein [Pseudomonadota bacterium]
MNKEQKIIKYWSAASKQDFETAEILFENMRYHHALFFCHLSIEKILKAIIVKKTQEAPPLLHDLVRLAEKAVIELSDKKKNELAEISIFNIEARYDDYKFSFYKKANKRFTAKYVNKTRKILIWLNKNL